VRFSEIRDAVASYAGQNDTGAFSNILKRSINDVYKRILDSGQVAHEHREFSFTPATSKSQHGLPLYVRKVINIEDPTTPSFIWRTTAREYDRKHPGTTETGTPREAYSLGMRGVEKFPNSDGVISFVSDDASDSGQDYKIRITGFNTSGVLITETVQLSGTSAVTTTNSYDSTLGIERVTKVPGTSLVFSGNVTVKDDDANTISVIPTFWDSPDYEWIEFHPGVGDTAITYTIRADMRKPPLVNDEDWPEFDQEFHDLLVFGTTMDLLPTLGQSSVADRHRATFERRWREFEGVTNDTQGGFHVFANVQAAAQGWSQRPNSPLIRGVDMGLAQ
jgi:hypothetical protein